MSIRLPISPSSNSSFVSDLPNKFMTFRVVNCVSVARWRCATTQPTNGFEVSRRSANYKPTIWDYDRLTSLRTDHMHETCWGQLENLKEGVRQLFREANQPLDLLELIDAVQRLGVGYHFDKEINEALHTMLIINKNNDTTKDLYATALRFRLLRQHGFEISQNVFKKFMDDKGSFVESLGQDMKGILCLYEASHLVLEGENIVEEANAFTSKQLKDIKGNIPPNLAKQVEHALELPSHWRMQRLDARWYIDSYEKEEHMNPTLLELAKLDFNIVQAIHRNDLTMASRWWRNLHLQEKLPFARDRLVECFFCALGTMSDPQYEYCRRNITKVDQLIVTIDDIYDVYGSLDELVLFTDAVKRWDVNSIEQLPEYMKMCFLALFNTTNEIAYHVLREQGCEIIQYLKKAWADLCQSFLVELKWYKNGHIPSLKEYLNNGWISVSAPLILVHVYFLLREKTSKEPIQSLINYPDLIRWSAIIFRLSNDLSTSTAELERGDTPTAIYCYMHETGASEAIAREHVKGLISESWKKMNKELAAPSPFPRPFLDAVVNIPRTFLCLYQYGDGVGDPNCKTKDHIMSLLFNSIS